MNCLVIAAGRGERLSQKGGPKPLLRLLGLTLIERTILTAQRAGLQEFFVVTGYEADRVESHLLSLAQRRNLTIHFIHNDEWESKGNGVSVLKAKRFFNERFILLMVDHIFEEEALIELMNEKHTEADVVLVADFNINENPFVDVSDVTKVLVKNNTILDIGKNIKQYNAYDTGMFLCTPAIFHALEVSTQRGDTSLSGGVRVFAGEGKARTFSIKEHYWMDIDTPRDVKRARRLLSRRLMKPHDGWVSRKINRKFSLWVFTPLILILRPRITPNTVSVISALVGLLAGVFFFLRRALVGGILVQFASILDGCDGEIARLKKMESPFGNYFDAILDRYTDFFILLGGFFYVLRSGDIAMLLGGFAMPIVFVVSGLAMIGYIMVSYTSAKSVADFRYRYRGRFIATGRGRDIRLFMLFLGGVLAMFHPVAVLISILAVAVQSNAVVLRRVYLSWRYTMMKSMPINRNISAIIFDLDGTVADTMTFLTGLATRLLMETFGLSKDKARRKYLETSGLDFKSQMELMFPGHPENPRVVSAFEKRKREGIMRLPLFPDVIPTLEFLREKGIRRFICSSTPQDIINEYIQLHEIEGLVDECFGLKQDFHKSDQIDYILEHYRLKPAEVIFVGDSLRDGALTKTKSIAFVGVTRIFNAEEFQSLGHYSVGTLTEITNLWNTVERLREAIKEL